MIKITILLFFIYVCESFAETTAPAQPEVSPVQATEQNLQQNSPPQTTEVKPVEVPTKPITPPTQAATEKDVEKVWRFGAGISLGVNSKAKSDDVRYTDGSTNLKGTFESRVEDGFSIELEARNMPANSWGFMGGLTYDFERKIKSGNYNISGVTLLTDGGDKLKTSVIYANAVYRWNTFYIPFGLNYSILEYTAEPVSGVTSTSAEAEGGIGAQLGIGNMINENVVIELYSRVVTGTLKIKYDTETLSFEDATITSIMLTGKYLF